VEWQSIFKLFATIMDKDEQLTRSNNITQLERDCEGHFMQRMMKIELSETCRYNANIFNI